MTWSVDRAIEWSWLISCWLSVNVDEMCAQRSRREDPRLNFGWGACAANRSYLITRMFQSESWSASLLIKAEARAVSETIPASFFPNHHRFPAFTSEFPSFPRNVPQHRDALLIIIQKVSPAHGKYAKTRVLRRGSGCRFFV